MTITMPPRRGASASPSLQGVLDETLLAAAGKAHREDPVVGRTGGPVGNATLTAWTGLALLILGLAELVTLISVGRLITWHIAIGVALVPVALLKIGTTSWRMIRYYRNNRHYKTAGPPPLLLRLLGPLAVVSTLALLASGGALVYLGPARTARPLVTLLGQGISPLTLHQASFAVWGGAVGIHLLARLVPALQLTVLRRAAHPGALLRVVAGGVTAVAAVAAVTFVLAHAQSWTQGWLA